MLKLLNAIGDYTLMIWRVIKVTIRRPPPTGHSSATNCFPSVS